MMQVGEKLIIDGRAVAKEVRGEVAERVAVLRRKGVVPKLCVCLVGDDPASQVYVRNKDRAGIAAGLEVETHTLAATTATSELLALIERFNRADEVHGILIQLPLPEGMETQTILHAVDPAKDVDGLHPANVGALWRGEEGLVPCTPAGCIELLDRSAIPIEGKRACIIGRSALVGKPVAALLLQRNATVTICHSRTPELQARAREAELLVAAVGRAELVRGDWVRPGAAVLDVGINRRDDGRLVGDVAFAEVREVAGAVTPVPGGIGPMTIAMLLQNTARAAARQSAIDWKSLAP